MTKFIFKGALGAAFLLALSPAALCAQTPVTSGSATAVAKDIAAKIGKLSGFTANVESGERVEGEPSGNSVASLMVSRLYGWKMTATGNSPYTIITDFNTFYQYFPMEKRAMKTTADSPEIKAMLTKPVTDMNPIALLDPQSLRFLGEEKLGAETVYRIEGTTDSQMMPGGPLVKRTLSAWLSVEDGLPRKTIESVGPTTGTTEYRNVKINPALKPADFSFTPPPGVTVIDTNEQIRKMEQQMNTGLKPKAAPASSK